MKDETTRKEGPYVKSIQLKSKPGGQLKLRRRTEMKDLG